MEEKKKVLDEIDILLEFINYINSKSKNKEVKFIMFEIRKRLVTLKQKLKD